MIPAHAALPLEALERLLCATLGHRMAQTAAALPLFRGNGFPVCVTCGKWDR